MVLGLLILLTSLTLARDQIEFLVCVYPDVALGGLFVIGLAVEHWRIARSLRGRLIWWHPLSLLNWLMASWVIVLYVTLAADRIAKHAIVAALVPVDVQLSRGWAFWLSCSLLVYLGAFLILLLVSSGKVRNRDD